MFRRSNPRLKGPVYIVSACLAGIACNYKGRAKSRAARNLLLTGKAIAVCPELLGGLPVPRPPSEISGGAGMDVISGRAKVMTRAGQDVTDNFVRGAVSAYTIAAKFGIRKAVLCSKSPSCGLGKIFDGTFRGKTRKGNGVFAALLRQKRFELFTE